MGLRLNLLSYIGRVVSYEFRGFWDQDKIPPGKRVAKPPGRITRDRVVLQGIVFEPREESK